MSSLHKINVGSLANLSGINILKEKSIFFCKGLKSLQSITKLTGEIRLWSIKLMGSLILESFAQEVTPN